MRFMKIEAKVRLKNFEHIVDLIESDGGELIQSNYEGKDEKTPHKKGRGSFTRTHLTADLVQKIKTTAKNHPTWTRARIGRMHKVSINTVTNILEGRRDHLLRSK